MLATARYRPGGDGEVCRINLRAHQAYTHPTELPRTTMRNRPCGDSEVSYHYEALGRFSRKIRQGTLPATCTEHRRGPFWHFLEFRTKSGPAPEVTLVRAPPYAEMCAHPVRRIYKRGKQKIKSSLDVKAFGYESYRFGLEASSTRFHGHLGGGSPPGSIIDSIL
jgi:hypothetical protein